MFNSLNFRLKKVVTIVALLTASIYILTPESWSDVIWRFFGGSYELVQFDNNPLAHYNLAVFVSAFIALFTLISLSFLGMLRSTFAYQTTPVDVDIVKYYKPPAMLNREQVSNYVSLSEKYEVKRGDVASGAYDKFRRMLTHGMRVSN